MILGILGGIGSGKSTVTRLFAEAGCAVIDADQIAHELLKIPAIKSRIRDRFGDEVIDLAGEVDRQALARRVFDRPAELADLNALVHPPVRDQILEKINAHRRQASNPSRSPREVLVLDVSLLASSPLSRECDHLLFVDASEALRQSRCESRGWSPDEISRRENHQAPLAEKRRMARWIIDNNGLLDETRRQVQDVLQKLIAASRAPQEIEVDSS